MFIFSTSVQIWHLWQLKTVVFLHRYLICAVLLSTFSINLICRTTFCWNFPASYAGQWVLNKDLAVWLDAARPANTCIPPSFLWNAWMELRIIMPHPKVCLQKLIICQFQWNDFFILNIQKKCMANSHWATANLLNVKFVILTCPMWLGSTVNFIGSIVDFRHKNKST